MKSWLASDGPSSLGADSATPAPCTSTIAATAAAAATSDSENCPRSGSSGSGRPFGIAPLSLTWATLSSPATITTIVGTARATEPR